MNSRSHFVLLLLLLLPFTAHAHTEPGAVGGFLSGFQHPLTGLDHIVAMVAVGLWGAYLGAPAMWLLPVVFPMVMALGGAFGVLGVPVPAVETGIALSGILLVRWPWGRVLVRSGGAAIACIGFGFLVGIL
jgi:urease accessory protein